MSHGYCSRYDKSSLKVHYRITIKFNEKLSIANITI